MYEYSLEIKSVIVERSYSPPARRSVYRSHCRFRDGTHIIDPSMCFRTDLVLFESTASALDSASGESTASALDSASGGYSHGG